MVKSRRPVIVLDTSVLVNFLRIDRMDLIDGHSAEYVVTDHVAGEITDFYVDQQARLARALKGRTLQQRSLTDFAELTLFSSLVGPGRLGAGECSAIALAVHKNHCLAIDDRRAINEAKRFSSNLEVERTQDLVVSMIRERLLDVDEANTIKESWEKEHHFRLAFDSFRGLLDQRS